VKRGFTIERGTPRAHMSGPVVQGLWVGSRSPRWEQVSSRRFLATPRVSPLLLRRRRGVTARVVLKTGLPSCREPPLPVQRRVRRGSYAAVSNAFRYKLLLERGRLVGRLPTWLLRPFDLADERLWASERADPPGPDRSTCVIKAPQGDR